VAGLATAVVATLAGKRETGSYAAALNATSHIIWGDRAGKQNVPSLKYTLTGFLLDYASAIFWAVLYEKLFGRAPVHRGRTIDLQKVRSPTPLRGGSLQQVPLTKRILGAGAVTAVAYITDYHLIPKRFTPGFEKRLSGKSLAAIFVALGTGLVARDVIEAAKTESGGDKKRLR
jgi:hypothetical protein